jgi:hypothetical protein
MQLTVINNEFCKFEKNKLTISQKCTRDEWMKIGEGLKLVEGSVQFWIGDWARFGEKNGYYTDSKTYDDIEEKTGYDRSTIQTFKSVANSVPSLLRNKDLSFNHHKEVSSLSEEKQKQFLDRAAEEKLSVRELREEIRKDAPATEPILKIETSHVKVTNIVIDALCFIEKQTSSESLEFEKMVYLSLIESLKSKLNNLGA